MTLRRRLAIALALSPLLVAGAALVAHRRISSYAARIRDVDEAEAAPVAIAFGAGLLHGGAPSTVLRDRLVTAAALYRAGKVKKVLVTGDHGRKGYDEVAAMAAVLEAEGVPPEDIFLDHA